MIRRRKNEGNLVIKARFGTQEDNISNKEKKMLLIQQL
jgi:hypothetical protein